jgi:hypothetical protein
MVYLTTMSAAQNETELERMWKEKVVAQFKALSLRSPGGTEEDQEKPGQDLNRIPPEYVRIVSATANLLGRTISYLGLILHEDRYTEALRSGSH